MRYSKSVEDDKRTTRGRESIDNRNAVVRVKVSESESVGRQEIVN